VLSLSNGLSFLRAPLAFLFLMENVYVRLLAIVLAMLTDSIDGYLARRLRSVTSFGAILDPVMDKFFVFFVLVVFLTEGRLKGYETASMLSRDFFLCLFGLYLAVTGNWKVYSCRAVRSGKVTTALQFFVLIGLTLGYQFPSYLFGVFFFLGLLAFWELWTELRLLKKSLPR
jgi:CDP-diacylglycerol--glycerol-3-phosphate 3-phosphatidyltransferase